MKKPFPTVLDSSAENWERILVSAGKLGMLLEVTPGELAPAVKAELAPVIK